MENLTLQSVGSSPDKGGLLGQGEGDLTITRAFMTTWTRGYDEKYKIMMFEEVATKFGLEFYIFM